MAKKLVLQLFAISIALFPTGNSAFAQEEQHVVQSSVMVKDAAWCWFSDPRAIYYKGRNEQIYYGYINSEGDVMIGSKDMKDTIIKSATLHSRLQIDDHNVPSILVLPDGRLLVFYSEHNGRFFMRKSKYAEDISEWEEEQTLDFGMKDKKICYSHPVMLSGEQNRIYVFYRAVAVKKTATPFADWWQCFSYSDDGGETWAEGRRYIDTKGVNNPIYLKASSDNKNRIDFLFTDGHPKIGPSSVYHMYYQEGNFHQTSGEKLGALNKLVDIDKVNKIYDVTVNKVKSWIWDVALNKRGRPVVTYTRYPSESDHRYHYAQWDGKQWKDEELCKAGRHMTLSVNDKRVLEEHYSGGIVLNHDNTDQVFLSKQINGIFEIGQWTAKKNGRWKIKNITRESSLDNIRPYVVYSYTGSKPLLMWMTGAYYHYTKFKTDLRINR